MNTLYEERISGTVYYCRSTEGYEYIFLFEGDDKYHQPSINLPIYEWSFSTFRSFLSDWENKTDKELRLATPEEIELLRKYVHIEQQNYSPEIY